MIPIQRSLIRRLRAVFRRVTPGSARMSRPTVCFHANGAELRVCYRHGDVALEYRQTDFSSAETLSLPLEALADLEGRSDAEVALELAGPERVLARWEDDGIPQTREYEVRQPDNESPFPESPELLAEAGGSLLPALDDARGTTPEMLPHSRFAVRDLLLRGDTGLIVATDGRQLLVQSGFRFPWTEDLLVPATSVFGCPEFSRKGPVEVGRTGEWVTVRSGPWRVHLKIADGRFPPFEEAIPGTDTITTRWSVSQQDAACLLRELPRLPGRAEPSAPVLLDLNRTAIIRGTASGEEQEDTAEVFLPNSEISGEPLRVRTSRTYLLRALRLGFREFEFGGPNLMCRDEHRIYVWAALQT